MDARDGFSTTKNPGGLLVMPYDYSTWPTTQERQQQKQYVTGEPDTWKLVSPVCAVRRVVISLPEAGGMREEIPGLLAYLEAKAEGDQACQGSGAYSKAL